MDFDVALVSTYQDTDEKRIDSEVLGSLDMVLTAAWGPGELLVYAEGSSSPQPGEVSSTFGEVNGDAGSALNGNGDGRLQVSELRYALPVKHAGTVHAGLLDAPCFSTPPATSVPNPGRISRALPTTKPPSFLVTAL